MQVLPAHRDGGRAATPASRDRVTAETLKSPETNIASAPGTSRTSSKRYDGDARSRSPPTTRGVGERRPVGETRPRSGEPFRDVVDFPETRHYVDEVLSQRDGTRAVPGRVRGAAAKRAHAQDRVHRPRTVRAMQSGRERHEQWNDKDCIHYPEPATHNIMVLQDYLMSRSPASGRGRSARLQRDQPRALQALAVSAEGGLGHQEERSAE